MIYTINGKPHSYITPKHGSYSYEDYKQALVIWQLSIEEQHRGKQIYIRGPLEITFRFFFKNKQRSQGHNPGRPDLFPLIKFALVACEGIIFTKDLIVSQINAQKFYDVSERTEIEVKTL